MNNSTDHQIENRTMPACTIIPVLGYKDVAEAIEWLCDRFGFRERWRAGNHRAQLIFEGGTIALTHQPAMPAVSSHSLLVRVRSIDKHYDNVVAKGALVLTPPADFPYGERQYIVEDIGGHQWTFSQSITDLAPEDWGGTTAAGAIL